MRDRVSIPGRLLASLLTTVRPFVLLSNAMRVVACSCLLIALLASCGGVPRTSLPTMPEAARIVHPDDSLFNDVLSRAIQPNGSISYSAIQGDTELTEYLRQVALARPEIFPSRQQQLAFWLNAYNANVLDVIRSNWPVRNIDDISGFFGAKYAWIAGERFSLNDIAKTQLTRNFREPRAFFALYDGSRSAPQMAARAFEESGLSDQLDTRVRAFLADSTKNRLEKKDNLLYLSPIFKEYSDELEKPAGSVIAFVRAFAPPTMGTWIDAHPLLKISYYSQDYSVFTNDATHEQPSQQAPQQKPTVKRSSGGIK